MHVAGCTVFDGKAPAYDELRRGDRLAPASRPALPPAACVRSVRAGAAGVGRRSALQRHLPRPPHRAAAARRRGASSSGSPGACSPRRSTAAGRCGSCGWSRGSPTTASRCSRRRITRLSTVSPASTSRPCCLTPRRIRCRSRRPSTNGSHGRCQPRRSCSPTRCSSAPRFPARSCAASARRCADRARSPRRLGQAAGAVGAMTRAGLQSAPPSPFNVRIGPHRRFTWVAGDLAQFKAIKNALGGTVNDVVLAVVAGALGRYMRLHGHPTDEVELKAMVPVSVRADVERGALGNRVAAMWAPLPVGVTDPVERLAQIRHAMDGIKESGQAVGAQVLTRAVRLRAADDHGPGRPPAGPPALVQPRGHERSRPAVPAVRARTRARGRLPDGPAGREHRARDRDHELQRPAQLRADSRLRRARRRRDARRRAALLDRRTGRGRGRSRAGAGRVAARVPSAGAPSGRSSEASRNRARAGRHRRCLAGPLDRPDRRAVRLLPEPRPRGRLGLAAPAAGQQFPDLGPCAPESGRAPARLQLRSADQRRPRSRAGAPQRDARSTTTSCSRRSRSATS